ncbi:alpha/beta fold hydrolase [Duganella sp. FT80W]|uniref:Alpha/beta fold hydrolase n=1 Tax=Duganella guangzhouensis TaxID=2666084 RepID=A0A6I2KY25_9BURK|nr:alpha/beta hydrolase [Duganella guangzhouensis]MRW90653.1 alpha/beta fold hydrolase [Duganella guangzhouensis]
MNTVSLTSKESKLSVVLVHGAFVDGSGWQAVHRMLSARGYEVLVVQNPTITLEGDVAATERVIGLARHPVILVGHSYGGAVVTEAGDHPKVIAVVYLAAFVPDVGESVAALNAQPAEPGEAKAPVLPPQDGFLMVDPAQFPAAFGADVRLEQTRFMAASQVPWGLGAVTGTVTRAAWRNKPTHYLVALDDLMIPPSAQRRMASRAGARTIEIASSHAVMLARPDEVASFIETATSPAE